MALNYVRPPVDYYPDFNTGRPIFNGDIYVGEPDTDPEIGANQKQITIRQEDGTEIPVSQPMKTSSGGVPIYNGSPVQILVDGNYSIKVLNKQLSQVYYQENAFDGEPVTTTTGDTRYAAIFGSVADMLALTPLGGVDYVPVSGDLVRTTSYYTSIPYTEPQGGGGEYRVMSLAEYGLTPDEIGAAFTVGAFVFVRVFSAAFSVKDFGAKSGDLAFDSSPSVAAAFLHSAANSILCDHSGMFRLNAPIVLDSSYTGLNVIGKGKYLLHGDFASSNVAAFIVPSNTVNYIGGGTNPANNITVDHIELDGSSATTTAFSTGLVIASGSGINFKRVVAHDFLKSGCLVASEAGVILDCTIGHIESYDNSNGVVGQGFANDCVNEHDSLTVGKMSVYRNETFGFDFSGGPITVGEIESYENGNNLTAGGGKFTGGSIQAMRLGVVKCHNNLGKGILSNTANYKSLHIDRLELTDNNNDGLDLAFSGDAYIGHANVSGNANNGILQDNGGNLVIGKLVGDANGSNLLSVSVGSVDVQSIISSNHAAGAAALIATTGQVNIGSVISNDDNNGGVRLVASSTQDNVTIGPVLIDHSGVPTSGFGVFVNASSVGAKIGKIKASGGASAISDAGVGTDYYRTVYRGLLSVDLPSIPSGSSYEVSHTITGVSLGDFVDVSLSKTISGLSISGYVSAADTVSAVFTNSTGTPIDITTANLRFRVEEK